MKNFLSYIAEVMDRPFPWRPEKGGLGREGQNIFVFSPSRDEQVKVRIEFFGSIDLSFTTNESMRITNRGNAGRILATVLDILREFMKECEPDEITFIAPTDSPARARVYERMTRKHLQGTDHELTSVRQRNNEEIEFIISRKDDVF